MALSSEKLIGNIPRSHNEPLALKKTSSPEGIRLSAESASALSRWLKVCSLVNGQEYVGTTAKAAAGPTNS